MAGHQGFTTERYAAKVLEFLLLLLEVYGKIYHHDLKNAIGETIRRIPYNRKAIGISCNYVIFTWRRKASSMHGGSRWSPKCASSVSCAGCALLAIGSSRQHYRVNQEREETSTPFRTKEHSCQIMINDIGKCCSVVLHTPGERTPLANVWSSPVATDRLVAIIIMSTMIRQHSAEFYVSGFHTHRAQQ